MIDDFPPKMQIIVSKADKTYPNYYTGKDGNCGDLHYRINRVGCLIVTYLTLDGDGVHHAVTQIYAPGTWTEAEVTERLD